MKLLIPALSGPTEAPEISGEFMYELYNLFCKGLKYKFNPESATKELPGPRGLTKTIL